ncbi:MAG: hypothetical protein R3301_05760 [Saprospiraceae bacterium]|nr:hypothetical protein [Saprospiraceae bacterium]
MRYTHTLLALSVLAVTAVLPVSATTFTFTGAANALWTDDDNWLPDYPGTVILEGDVVVIEAECTIDGQSIVIHGGLTIAAGNKLILSGGGTIENWNQCIVFGELQLLSGTVLTNRGITTVHPAATVTNAAYLINNDGLLLNHGTVLNQSGGFQNSGFAQLIHATGASWTNTAQFDNGGIVLIEGTGFSNYTTFQNDGDLTITGQFDNHGDLHNNSVVTIQGLLTVTGGGSLLNHAILDVAPSGHCTVDGIFNNFVFGEILHAGALVCESLGLFTNQGAVTTFPGSAVNNFGFMTNEGPILHEGTFTNHGAFVSHHIVRNEGAIDNHGIFTVEPSGDLQLKDGSHFVSYEEGVLTIK